MKKVIGNFLITLLVVAIAVGIFVAITTHLRIKNKIGATEAQNENVTINNVGTIQLPSRTDTSMNTIIIVPKQTIVCIPLDNVGNQLEPKTINIKELKLYIKTVEGFNIGVFAADAYRLISGDNIDIINNGALDEFRNFINLQKDNIVADIGTGMANYSLAFSNDVGPKGKIISTDINPNCEIYNRWKIDLIINSGIYDKQIKGKQIGNNLIFQTNSLTDVNLKTKVDVAILINVHLFNNTNTANDIIAKNKKFAISIINSLKKDGRIIIIDYYRKGHGNLLPDEAIKQIMTYFPNCKITKNKIFDCDFDIKTNIIYGIEIKKLK